MILSEQFKKRTNKKYLYNLQPIANMSSIVQHGLLSNVLAEKIRHKSIAMPSVQNRRNQIKIHHELSLHEYANVYFDYWNPMLSARRHMNPEICILVLSPTILDIPGTIISDCNAASSFAHFYSVEDGLQIIDFRKVFAKYWGDEEKYIYQKNKAMKCAEVLVPAKIEYSYVLGAVVYNEEALHTLEATQFDKQIVVREDMFFKEGI